MKLLANEEDRWYSFHKQWVGGETMEYSHEIILPNEDLPFKMFIFEGKDGKYVRDKHWHNEIEIFAVFDGEVHFFLNEEEYFLETGEFLLINSNEVHAIFSPKKNKTIVIQIPISIFEHYYTSESFISFTHMSSSENTKIMELIADMYTTYLKKEFGYEFCVRSIFYNILSILVKHYRITRVSPELLRRYKKLNRLTDITNYIIENYQKELSLESLAEVFGYSPTYLSKMFLKYANINYREYLQNVRLSHAYQELMESDHMLSSIAVNHGFANSKAFAKAFKKKYGVLPSEYRKQNKELEHS